ncbi:putative ABC transporter [Streptomyces lydicamycinicus]|uniref:Putative ABC transporter n=1 Tax=Streptomyces lydicamycinicus TaxID=1546107 RepID=A0A0P4RFK4_9ACTN|nr:putative ABC transporter [Streptomyces lydicamycinicus]
MNPRRLLESTTKHGSHLTDLIPHNRQFVVVEMETLAEKGLEGGVTGDGGAGQVDGGDVEVSVRSVGGHGGRVSV